MSGLKQHLRKKAALPGPPRETKQLYLYTGLVSEQVRQLSALARETDMKVNPQAGNTSNTGATNK